MPEARPGYEKTVYRDWLDRPDTLAGPLDDSDRRRLARNVARPKCGRRQAVTRPKRLSEALSTAAGAALTVVTFVARVR
jgi:hypothetical protein